MNDSRYVHLYIVSCRAQVDKPIPRNPQSPIRCLPHSLGRRARSHTSDFSCRLCCCSRPPFSPVLVSLVSIDWLRRRSVSQLAPTLIASVQDVPVGGVKLFSYPTAHDPCLLIRLSQDQFVAYSQKCTHLSCPVTYKAKRKNFSVRVTLDVLRWTMDECLEVHRNGHSRAFSSTSLVTKFGRLEYGYEHSSNDGTPTTEHDLFLGRISR